MLLQILTEKLNERERKFAEDNHKLIYKFLGSRNLKANDFYDIVVFGYLRSVKKYFRNTDTWYFEFSTIAYREMSSELFNFYEKNKNNFEEFSHDEIPCFDDNFSNQLLTIDIKKALSENDFLLYQARLQGMSLKEISEYFRFSYSTANRKINLIKKIIKKLIGG